MQKIFVTLFLLVFSSLVWSQQSQEELEEKKVKIQAEIREKEKLLQDVKNKEKSVVNLLSIQKEKIGLKEKLITTTEKITKLLGNDIYSNQIEINKLKKELETLKDDYSDMIVKSYKSRSMQSRAMFLLSSENFLQAYKRLQYMKQYSSFRKMQADEIKDKSIKLDDRIKKLSGQKTEKEKLLADQEKQKLDLIKEKLEQEKIANSLKKDKKQIAAEVKKKQQEAKKIDAQIQKMIREAIAEANRKAAAAKAKANPKKTTAAETKAIESSTKIVLTPEGKIISDNFKANKGNLPWPVEKGDIYMGFGKQRHPVYKELEENNSGLKIITESGASARCVFKGEVSQIQKIGNKFLVYVRHGEFFSVYQNLSSVSVSEGDMVAAKQTLGKIKTDSDGKTILKFMITQNTTPTNPSLWISRK